MACVSLVLILALATGISCCFYRNGKLRLVRKGNTSHRRAVAELIEAASVPVCDSGSDNVDEADADAATTAALVIVMNNTGASEGAHRVAELFAAKKRIAAALAPRAVSLSHQVRAAGAAAAASSKSASPPSYYALPVGSVKLKRLPASQVAPPALPSCVSPELSLWRQDPRSKAESDAPKGAPQPLVAVTATATASRTNLCPARGPLQVDHAAPRMRDAWPSSRNYAVEQHIRDAISEQPPRHRLRRQTISANDERLRVARLTPYVEDAPPPLRVSRSRDAHSRLSLPLPTQLPLPGTAWV